MAGPHPSTTDSRHTPRGRIDKRNAILEAAFAVFARDGYAKASVDAIADAAGVAKPTVYNHFGGKEGLFRQAVSTTAERATARSLAVVHGLGSDVDDLAHALREVGYRLLLCYTSEEAWALRRLLHAEISRFPDVFDTVRGSGPDQFSEALADRLARLALAGRLRLEDPVRAAEQFVALLTGPVEGRSALGTRPVSDQELRDTVAAAVETFTRAFAVPRGRLGDGPSSGQEAAL
ncbi:transcriptional regulator, TetR family [Streptoalloteichus tenebrarius]|uniref:Transcriptional regulator, TetR family n=1 Tax=Streptoalloteichus tenebrarius (strain ATCC 17920 / DSM 40477 / JCM 4838 / CBS 697.72 / NBRC 16177 / NCIMB 11028 / NRRL B-12390 / A12253. 1 / ISP 5477) TaxID=1933 RepID=A0ABT1I0R6_STRSD|nr:TetR/AcrR family transcriptional regulator [Streptoalloteichus tenebrarius]MCP2261323.1 transcriptional regulator, TetR family [Streptoalloteichus tenebrarius]BFF03723.1 TetR/AcrR family transcriptional regulator [Streptoalloteichus tenebrarius]